MQGFDNILRQRSPLASVRGPLGRRTDRQEGRSQGAEVYLRRAVEVHAGHWEGGHVHCDTAIQVQRADYAEESSADDRPGGREKQGTRS